MGIDRDGGSVSLRGPARPILASGAGATWRRAMGDTDPKRPKVVLKRKINAMENSGDNGGPPRHVLKRHRSPGPETRGGEVKTHPSVDHKAMPPSMPPARKTVTRSDNARESRTNGNNAGGPGGQKLRETGPSTSIASRALQGAAAATAAVAAARAPVTRSPPPAVVAFDVGGQIFKVSAQLVRSKPKTLLATLLQQAENGLSKPIFVDGPSERFHFILDWYRHNAIHIPRSVSLAALLQDARHFQLPDEVIVNGVARNVKTYDTAQRVSRELIAGVISRWPGFPTFLEELLEKIRKHFEAVAVASDSLRRAEAQDAEEAWDFPQFVLTLYGDEGFLDQKNLLSAARARMLALKLEECGYLCEFSDTELLVGLPLRLLAETADGGMGQDALGEESYQELEGGGEAAQMETSGTGK